MILTIILSLTSIVFCILFIFSRIREKKLQEQSSLILGEYLTYLNKISDIIELSNIKIRQIDEKESFKSDDEIGFFFDNIKEIQNILNNFIIKDIDDDTSK